MSKRPKVSIDAGVAVIDDKRIPLRNLRVDRVIDSGAHGSVFEATETALDRKVAVKVWYRLGEKVRDGAICEVRKLASLSHPLFVTVYQLDVAGDAPYSAMELLPGPSLKKWLCSQYLSLTTNDNIFDHLQRNRQNLRQRCKFWFLYSAGLNYLYSRDILHGDPHVGNVIVYDDHVGTLDHLLVHHSLTYGGLLSIRMLDLGTSLLWSDPAQIRVRESRVIFETAEKLFPDFNPRQVMTIETPLEPAVMLGVLNKYAEYVLELSSIPGLTQTDFDFLSHGLPQLLGWCPFFNYETVSEHLASLFQPHDAAKLIRDTLWQMQQRHVQPSAEDYARLPQRTGLAISDAVGDLTELSKRFRSPRWRDE